MKFLVDECLSEELAKLARERGHPESSHVVWLGKRGWQDWNLMPVILAGGWTFVTKNSADFRGPSKAVGRKGQHSKAKAHAGLICLNGPVGMDLDMQLELFGIAVSELGPDPDLLNHCLEVILNDDGLVRIIRYSLPARQG
jgi:hypothetical protein